MANLTFTKKAVGDLTQIWKFTYNNWSETQADKYYYMLIENCKEIANNPEVGKKYSGVAEHLFGFKAGRHIIFYRKIDDNDVEITRILHERMDIKSRLG